MIDRESGDRRQQGPHEGDQPVNLALDIFSQPWLLLERLAGLPELEVQVELARSRLYSLPECDPGRSLAAAFVTLMRASPGDLRLYGDRSIALIDSSQVDGSQERIVCLYYPGVGRERPLEWRLENPIFSWHGQMPELFKSTAIEDLRERGWSGDDDTLWSVLRAVLAEGYAVGQIMPFQYADYTFLQQLKDLGPLPTDRCLAMERAGKVAEPIFLDL